MVRDANMLSLEEAHFRFSALPAWSADFQDRGTLHEGLAADIIVYDLANLKSGSWEGLHDSLLTNGGACNGPKAIAGLWSMAKSP